MIDFVEATEVRQLPPLVPLPRDSGHRPEGVLMSASILTGDARSVLGTVADGAIWLLSSSSDPRALAVVDGVGAHDGVGPHYSRRTPGSRTFTGVGQEVVLVTADGTAVWAVVRQRTPTARGTGSSRGRGGATDGRPRFVWRNMLFRNLGPHRSSDLIRSAHRRTIEEWIRRYGKIPPETLRTEVDGARVKSTNPGYCYKVAGWTPIKRVGTKIYLAAPALVDERGQLDLSFSGAA